MATPSTPNPARPNSIPPSRDLLQSRALALLTVLVLLAAFVSRLHLAPIPQWWPSGLAASLVLALASWKLRAATLPAASLGALISLCLIFGQPWAPGANNPHRNAFPALLALVLTTQAATRFGRTRKEATGTAESRTGRRASQIAANLAVAALCATGNSIAGFAACLAALAEATADTVSSEVGQALSGPTWLITSARRVPPGTDGGISLLGTAAGLCAAALVPAIIALTQPLSLTTAVSIALAAAAGLLFDSLLGATLERKGWLGNDLVNLSSTAFAATLAYTLLRALNLQ